MSRALYVVSLGCAKNRVDTEEMVARLAQGGWSLCEDPALADAILVNTCAFIRPATQESIDTILDLSRHKTEGRCARLVVAGCLPQRYRQDLAAAMPEVDCFVGVPERGRILEVLEASAATIPRTLLGSPFLPEDHEVLPARRSSGVAHVGYLKIADGCDHRCAFCVIPSLRGPYRSRPQRLLVEEARHLVEQGARELNLVAQDTMGYGRDLGDRSSLLGLCEALCELPELLRVRILYSYPRDPPAGLLDLMASGSKLCRYLDIPLQHASDRMLAAMRRGLDRAHQEERIASLRERVPGITLRSTFIVGFPGETEADVAELLDFLRRARFERVGLFPYHAEEGSAAASLPGRVPERERKRRFKEIHNEVVRLGREIHRARIGRVLPVLVDGPSDEADWLWEGREEGQAPEVDGRVFFSLGPEQGEPGGGPLPTAGSLVPVRILDANEVDLTGEIERARVDIAGVASEHDAEYTVKA